MPAMKKCLVAAMLGSLGLLSLAAPSAAEGDPPGNNGTVKIDGVPFDDHPDNEPHDGCVFQVDFYGFDEGDLEATVTFALVAPTPRDGDIVAAAVDIGQDAAGGGTDLDAAATYDLGPVVTDVVPHPQQSLHVRLTVHAEGSRGADTKHKVFWITGCGATPPSTTSSSTTSSTTTSSTTTSSTTPGGPTTSVVLQGGTVPTGPGNGGGGGGTAVVPAGSTGTTATRSGGLPVTGSDAWPLAWAGALLAVLGTASVVIARRLKVAPSDR